MKKDISSCCPQKDVPQRRYNLEIRNLIPLRTERWNPDGCLPDIMSGIYKENPTVTIIGMQAVRPSALLHRYSPTVIIWGNYIEIKFSYPPGTADGASVKYLNADLRLYADEAKTDLIARDSVTLDLRYDAKRYSEATAQAESSPGP